ncbi:MAG: ABC transporter substrate-binding protein [Tepidisphaeraceae bacterium]
MLRMIRNFGSLALIVAAVLVTAVWHNRPAASSLVVGFSQVGAESGWRTANTNSFKSEAAARGIDLHFSDAQQKQENQIKALKDFAAQHVDAITFSPVVETGWAPVLKEIKAKGIPVVIEDRRADVDPSLYASFIGSDFLLEGHRVGDWLATKTGGKATIAVLEGTPGSAAAEDRKKGFAQSLADHPDMKVIWSQTGNFTRQGGKEAFEAFLKSPDAKGVTALFAHNDDMALGAIQAMEEAGIKPGKDILVVSIDGVHDCLAAILAGKINCCVECNPLLGPKVLDTIQDVVAGKPVEKRVVVDETLFDETNVTQAVLDARKY